MEDCQKVVHEGYYCDRCHMYPIVGIRYTCANCANFDLCEGLFFFSSSSFSFFLTQLSLLS